MIQKGPFQTVLDVVNGVNGEGNGLPENSVPENAIVMGEVPDDLREFGSQVITHMTQAESIASTISGTFFHKGQIEEFKRKAAAYGNKYRIGEVLNLIFREALHCVLPQGNRWYGDFCLCKGWVFAAPNNAAVCLPDVKTQASPTIDGFYSTVTKICRGRMLYDDTLKVVNRASMGNVIIVGKLESSFGKQLYGMSEKVRRILAAYDPYQTEAEIAVAFKKASFEEYLRWKYDVIRLQEMHRALILLIGLCIAETIGEEKVLEYGGSSTGGMIQTECLNFTLYGDWDIALIK